MRFGFREIIFIMLLLAVPVGAYLFVFEPRNRQIADVREEIKRKQAKLEELEMATRKIPNLGEEIDRLSQAIDVIEQKLPDERKVDEVLKQVADISQRLNLRQKSVRTDKPIANGLVSELPITLETVGNFDDFYKFLLELEKLPRITQLPKMKLVKSMEKDSEQGQMKAEVVLTVFFESDDSALFGGSSRRGRRGL